MYRRPVLLWLGLIACASGPKLEPAAVEEPELPGENSSSFFGPAEIYGILDRSKVLYEIDTDSSIGEIPLAEVIEPKEPEKTVSSYLELRDTDGSGQRRLSISEPPAEIAELHERAFAAFRGHAFTEARDLYIVAAELRPDYFKTFTYLGNTYFVLGDLERAATTLRQAVAMNPVDYQAHLFLGDTYYQLGKLTEARHHLTWAYVLNRNNPIVQKRLDATLDQLHLRRKAGWIEVAVAIEETDENKVSLRFGSEEATRWFPLANCMACWTYETECKSRDEAPELPVRISMYRECLLNQPIAIAMRLEEGQTVPADERRLHQAVNAGYLDALIYWEIAAKRLPIIVFLLEEVDRQRIHDYIQMFVFTNGITT